MIKSIERKFSYDRKYSCRIIQIYQIMIHFMHRTVQNLLIKNLFILLIYALEKSNILI